ncbi:phosphoserine phosphatase SerB [Rhodobacteraceae bacterium 2CG4]|uniref:Phosphoserine phosphatase n=1 Tax=Halovulum marinum TaxID=2662447 RepID=A0A6L5Z2F6_9RHOB|nr:phosphoserine phosphatase SerB [Halovulum marinum]MSU90202.1 phosphoserine phosphatase SerB [Halovulum marinum]
MTQKIAVLTAAGPLPRADVETALARLAADPAGLKPLGASAAEVALPAGAAPDMDALREGLCLDVNLVPAEGRAKRILIADMDSTIIGVECIDELADFAGVKPQVAEITERAMRGELDFEQAIDARVGLLKNLSTGALQQCYDQRVRLNPGARALVQAMNAAGARTALVSGGFTFFTSRVAAAAGFASNQANVLDEADGRLAGTVRRPVLGREAKAAALRALCEELGVGPEAAVAIGDGANDLDMIRMAGLGVAYRAKPALRAEADAVLDHSDLTAVLALQGLTG